MSLEYIHFNQLPIYFKTHFPLDNGQEYVQDSQGKNWVEPFPSYHGDSMKLYSRNVGFLKDISFQNSYQLGMNSGHKFGGNLDIYYRVYTACWALSQATHLEGDFVECGVNTGILSLAAMNYVNFNAIDKNFYLFDTYCGIPDDQGLDIEKNNVNRHNESYFDCYELAKQNFSIFPRAILVQGKVPESLTYVNIDKISYLSIDMNLAYPEISAGEYFWDKLVPGGIILLDDYGFESHEAQQTAWDEFAKARGIKVLNMPSGQGLLIKPPH